MASGVEWVETVAFLAWNRRNFRNAEHSTPLVIALFAIANQRP